MKRFLEMGSWRVVLSAEPGVIDPEVPWSLDDGHRRGGTVSVVLVGRVEFVGMRAV